MKKKILIPALLLSLFVYGQGYDIEPTIKKYQVDTISNHRGLVLTKYEVITRSTEHELKKYKVETITRFRTIYIIELSKNDLIYRVLTKVRIGIRHQECETEKIETGKYYELELDMLYRFDTVESPMFRRLRMQNTAEFNGTRVPIELWETLYTTQNLKGLCLVR